MMHIQQSDDSYVILGVAAFYSASGCNVGHPSGFTRVSSHLEWISSVTGIAVNEACMKSSSLAVVIAVVFLRYLIREIY